MAEYIVRPAEHVDTPRLRVELRGDDYIVFGDPVEGEEAVQGGEYRTEDRDIAEALRLNPLLTVEGAEDGTEHTTDIRPTKAEIVNEYADGEVEDGDTIRAALAAQGLIADSEPESRPATSVETAPKPPDPPQDPATRDWSED